LQQLDALGIARIRMPDALVESENVRSFFDRLFAKRRSLVRASRLVVSPRSGERAIVGSNIEGPPHIDDDEFLPAHLQILCCVRPAPVGGESFYVDSWGILDRISAEEPSLIDLLFEEPRAFRYNGATPLRTTFAMRYGNLICSHAPTPDDEVGERFQAWVDRAPRYEFLAEQGDICIINHQRILHGRRSFEGSREFVRILYWMAESFAAPAQFVERAGAFAQRLTAANPSGPLWAREWLAPSDQGRVGLRRLAAVLAYVDGEDYERVCERHGVSPRELFQWAARVLAEASVSLGAPDAELDQSREVIERQSLEALEALLFERALATHRRETSDARASSSQR
jgi:hypothetical protein